MPDGGVAGRESTTGIEADLRDRKQRLQAFVEVAPETEHIQAIDRDVATDDALDARTEELATLSVGGAVTRFASTLVAVLAGRSAGRWRYGVGMQGVGPEGVFVSAANEWLVGALLRR